MIFVIPLTLILILYIIITYTLNEYYIYPPVCMPQTIRHDQQVFLHPGRVEIIDNNTGAKRSLNTTQPLYLFQSMDSRRISEPLAKTILRNRDLFVSRNIQLTYELFDDSDCRRVLYQLGPRYLQAFDMLLPGAYKCDVFRMANLYINGGLYMDAPMKILNIDRLIEIITENKPVIVRDIIEDGIYQAFLFYPERHNPSLKYILDHIVDDVINKVKVDCCFSLTGPRAFLRYYEQYVEASIPQTDGPHRDIYMLSYKKRKHINTYQYVADEKGINIIQTKYIKSWQRDRSSQHYSWLFYHNLVYNEDVTTLVQRNVYNQGIKRIFLSQSIYVHPHHLKQYRMDKQTDTHFTFNEFMDWYHAHETSTNKVIDKFDTLELGVAYQLFSEVRPSDNINIFII